MVPSESADPDASTVRARLLTDEVNAAVGATFGGGAGAVTVTVLVVVVVVVVVVASWPGTGLVRGVGAGLPGLEAGSLVSEGLFWTLIRSWPVVPRFHPRHEGMTTRHFPGRMATNERSSPPFRAVWSFRTVFHFPPERFF